MPGCKPLKNFRQKNHMLRMSFRKLVFPASIAANVLGWVESECGDQPGGYGDSYPDRRQQEEKGGWV